MLPNETRSKRSRFFAGRLRLRKTRAALRGIEAALLVNPEVTVTDLTPLLNALRLSLWRRGERALALRLVNTVCWTEEQRAVLSERICSQLRREIWAQTPVRSLVRWYLRFMVGLYPLIVCMAWSDLHFDSLERLIRFAAMGFSLVAFLSLIFSLLPLPVFYLIDCATLERCGPFVQTLGQLGQPSALATLATAHNRSQLYPAAAQALASVTARLRPEDYGTLPAETGPALCRALPKASPATALMIFKALAVIGDERAIEPVERHRKSRANPEIRAVAAELLAVLEQRRQESRAASHLLRASAAPQTSATLLRPVQGETITDPSQLLRATTSRHGEAE